MQVNDAMLKEDRRWLSDRQRLNATFSMFIKRMESLVRHCRKIGCTERDSTAI